MKNRIPEGIGITGIGITSAIGQGKEAFIDALMAGRHAFGYMRREGRTNGASYIGAEIDSLQIPGNISRRLLRTASLTGQIALTTLQEAYNDAALEQIPPERIGLVVGGSNLQQRELVVTQDSYRQKENYLRPTYGVTFLDSDICGMCTEQFGIGGFAHTVGGASASGQLAVFQAIQAVQIGQVDVAIALGALMDISYWECRGFRSLGAMGSARYSDDPARACRPFDEDRDGFIYGEACGAVVIEKIDAASARGVKKYVDVLGWATIMDANRGADPCTDNQTAVMQQAIANAGLTVKDIDYVNPHGTASILGDASELEAISNASLDHAYINATKSITGHSLSASGTVEIIATSLQMRASRLHPTRNLERPIKTDMNWVRDVPIDCSVRTALSLSFGFGGINTAICLGLG